MVRRFIVMFWGVAFASTLSLQTTCAQEGGHERKPVFREAKADWNEHGGGGRSKDDPERFLKHAILDPRFHGMLKLAFLEDEKLDEALQRWPRFAKWSEEERGRFRKRLEHFRKKIRRNALLSAERQGINLPKTQEDAFVRKFWEKALRMQEEIEAYVEPLQKKLQKQMIQELQEEFQSPGKAQ